VTVGGFAAEMHLFAARIREALGMKRSYQQIDFTGPIQVRHLMRYHIDTIPPDAGLHKIVRIMEHSRYSMLPVVGKNEEWIGMIFLTVIRDLFYNKELGQLIIAQDIAHAMTALSPEDSLAHAMQVFESESVPFLPVVEPKGQRRFLGVIHHRDIYLFQVDKEKGNS
jgi:CBS domain-containing protein